MVNLFRDRFEMGTFDFCAGDLHETLAIRERTVRPRPGSPNDALGVGREAFLALTWSASRNAQRSAPNA